MRAIWTGAIGFGLVNIPVKLFSATESSSLDLDMLDKKDHSNIKFSRINEKTGKEVKWENIVKGYKYDDEYIILTPADFEKANAVKTNTIEISEFVNEDEIDSIYYESPYYLEPEKSGVRAYTLLREALKKSKKVGVSSYVLRNKETLAILKPMDNVIVLNRIRFQEEIRDPNELHLPDEKTMKKGELEMAIKLIEQLTQPFDISEYKDTYKDELMKVIKAKANGKVPRVKKMEVVHSRSKDLMSQLKASLEKRKAS